MTALLAPIAKTRGKRATAIGLFTFLGFMFSWGASGNEMAMQAAEFLTLPVFTFGGAAFALDAFKKDPA